MLVPDGRVPVHMDYAPRLAGRAEPRIACRTRRTATILSGRCACTTASAAAGVVRPIAALPDADVADPEDLLLSQDVIFVGGGSVATCWRAAVHGLDRIAQGVAGWHRAGGIERCGMGWFEGGTTDRRRELRAFTDGLGLLAG